MNSAYAEVSVYGDAVRFTLRGNTLRDYEKGLEYTFDRLSQQPDGGDSHYLQTFVDVMYRDELEFFLQRGFFIRNVMLFMELDIPEFLRRKTELVNGAFPDGYLDLPGGAGRAVFETYDTSDLSEYLDANELGFGERDPENQIKEELEFENSKIYVARLNGRIVSSVTVWDRGEGYIATENIFTVPDYRERGLALNMLIKVLSTRAVNGAVRASLTVFGDDYEAISLYYKLGFKLVAEKYELRF